MLEDWLGARLFDRMGGRLELTAVGSIFHKRVSVSLVELASATADLLGQMRSEKVRLWSVPGLAFHWLSECLADFSERFPGSEIELRPSEVAADLNLMEADADIRFYGDAWQYVPVGRQLRSFELARPWTYPVATPRVASCFAAAESARALLEAPLLHEESRHEWTNWFALNGIHVPDQLPGALHWHAHLAIAAARQGRGVALANDLLVGRDLQEGTLVKVTPPGSQPVNLGAYVLIARADRWQSPPILRLRRFLHQRATLLLDR